MNVKLVFKSLFVVLFLAVLAVASVYLAGLFFLFLSKVSVKTLTFGTYYQYWYYYHDDPLFRKKLTSSALFAFMVGFFLPAVVVLGKSGKQRALHGAARFATRTEIVKAGLMSNGGILLGKLGKELLRFMGQEFVILAAPTRSGKGVGIVIPNLLLFPDSVVVLDIKQENFELTSGFRELYGQEVHLFNPFAEDQRSSRYNPLGYVRDGNLQVGDLTSIGEVLYPSDGGKNGDSFFEDQARNLFLGLGLYLCETPKLPRTIGEMLRQSSGKGKPVKEYLLGLIEARNTREVTEMVEAVGENGEVETIEQTTRVPITVWDGEGDGPPLSEGCVLALNRFCNLSDNTLSSVLGSFNAPLGIWSNPIVDAATSGNDFDLREVRRKRMSIYIGITPNKIADARRLVNLLFSQLVNLNTGEGQLPSRDKSLKYQCLLLMDEFTALGKVQIIAKAVSYMAGYNLRLLPIIQSMSQLADVYGKETARTFVTNHAVQIMFAPREQQDANEYSEMLGYETVKGKGISRNKGGKSGGGYSESESEQKRALLLPQELKEIGRWKSIVSLEDTKPILCDKIRYFDDPIFVDRLKEVSPSLRALGKKIPNQAQFVHAQSTGELSAKVRMLDVDTYVAIVEQRVRELSEEDTKAGVDLSKIALGAGAGVKLPKDRKPTKEEMGAYVDDFFNQVRAGSACLADDEEDTGQGSGGPATTPAASAPPAPRGTQAAAKGSAPGQPRLTLADKLALARQAGEGKGGRAESGAAQPEALQGSQRGPVEGQAEGVAPASAPRTMAALLALQGADDDDDVDGTGGGDEEDLSEAEEDEANEVASVDADERRAALLQLQATPFDDEWAGGGADFDDLDGYEEEGISSAAQDSGIAADKPILDLSLLDKRRREAEHREQGIL